MDLHRFYNYAAHTLIPQNTKSGEPELTNIKEKSQDKNDLILHNTTINSGWNKIADIMQRVFTLFQDR